MEGEEKKQVDCESSDAGAITPPAAVSIPTDTEDSVIMESKSPTSHKDIQSIAGVNLASDVESSNESSDSKSPDEKETSPADDVELKPGSPKETISEDDGKDQSTTVEVDSLITKKNSVHEKVSHEDESAHSKTDTETETFGNITAVEKSKGDSRSSSQNEDDDEADKDMPTNKNISEPQVQIESSRLSCIEGEPSKETSDDSTEVSDKSEENGGTGVTLDSDDSSNKDGSESSNLNNPDVPSGGYGASSETPVSVPMKETETKPPTVHDALSDKDKVESPSSTNEEQHTVAGDNQDTASDAVSEPSSVESLHSSKNLEICRKDSSPSTSRTSGAANDEDTSSTQCGETLQTSSINDENIAHKITDSSDTMKEISSDFPKEQKDINETDGKPTAADEPSKPSVSSDTVQSKQIQKEVIRETTKTNSPIFGESEKHSSPVSSTQETDSNSSKVGEEPQPQRDDSINVDSDVVPSSASADVDHENVEEPMEVSTQNDEDDPFFSCEDKEKDHHSPMEVDEPTRESESERVVDEPSGNDKISSLSDVSGEVSICDKPEEEVHKEESTLITETSLVEKTSIATDKNVVSPENIAAEPSAATVTDAACTENEDLSLADKPAASTEKSVENSAEEETITEDEPSATADGDDEVCIVPDTAPRVLTDKEKAEAFEKAKSSADATEGISGKSGEKEEDAVSTVKADSEKDESKVALKKCDKEETVADPEKSDKEESDGSKRKFNIQLVSTASLVSRKETPEKSQDDVIELSDIPDDVEGNGEKKCAECGKVTKCKYHLKLKGVSLCEDECYTRYRKTSDSSSVSSATTAVTVSRAYFHKCGQCSKAIEATAETTLTWETMDFCSEDCLEKYQKNFGACCANCKGAVQSSSLGKYCVRFGYDMKQFCSALCLEDFKKGLKVCSYCQKDISGGAEGFLAPVGDKGQFKDFCTQECMEKYDQMSNNTNPPEVTHECAVCNNVKPVKAEILMHSEVQKLCSDPCFAAYKFVNKISTDQCDMCKKHFDLDRLENFSVFYDDAPHSFCCKTCMNVYILAKRKIVPCTWCKVKKYNFDMIKKTSSNGQALMWCSLHCLSLYQVSISAAGTHKQIKCDSCNATAQAQYHLTMSDATLRSFCTYNCVQSFQGKYPNSPITVPGNEKAPHPLGVPRRIVPKRSTVPVGTGGISGGDKDNSNVSSMPVISSVTSLAPANGLPSSTQSSSSTSTTSTTTKSSGSETVKTVYKQQFIIRPPIHPEMSNCAVQVKPMSATKAVSCRPHSCTVGTQTDDCMGKPVLIPVPVPIYIPAPMHMYTSPYPVPVPIVLPIPVPIFIPTTRNSAKGIFKEIKRIQEKFPSDPFEAELLMMAEMVAGEKKAENTDTESEDGGNDGAADDDDANDTGTGNAAEPEFSPENVEANNSFGDDVLQIALKMASELDEPAVDFEAAVAPTTIAQTLPTQASQPTGQNNESDDDDESPRKTRSGRKRSSRPTARSSSVSNKRGRKSSSSERTNMTPTSDSNVPAMAELVEKPDANMCLKFTFGVNAWKCWVNQKNGELEKAGGTARKLKPFKTDLLQLTADELNYSLCLFVKEVKKPNGQEYAPDTIYYLCLGIQQYLIENGRVENIFSDPYYEKFTDCLDEVAKHFSNLYCDAQYLVTRIEEEHLWESKQLGAHSPYVLLSTLMFFNTKHFNLTTVEEHMQLSFTHIMKHWKRNPNATGGPKAPGSRNVLLRFYPPQSALAANSKKKKVYEQQENEDNPLRCPVKLYEFYLSKCPESVKTRNDVFYLLPERSCVPDSPVWYSTMALGYDQLQKMLHRIKMVKEINML